MKLILPRVKQALLFACFSTFLFAQQTGKKDYKNTLMGNVKSVRITTYVALDKGGGKFGKGSVAKGMDNFLISYDKKGNLTDKVAYYTNGKVWYTKKYVYEGSDIPKEVPEKMVVQPKEKVALEKTEEGFRGKVVYRYDKKGQKTEESSFDSKGTLLWRYVYRYNNKGHLLEKDNFDTQANLISRESYRYDTNEKVLEKTITMNNQTAYKCVWQYDDKGKVVEKEEYFTELITPEKLDKLVIDEINTQGVLWKKIKYSYDNKGNRVEVNVYDAQKKEAPKYAGGAQQPKKEQPKQPSYDELPNPKLLYTDEHDNLGNLWKKDTYVYDDKGQIIEVKSVDNEGKPLFRYTYKYDAKGREIERINYDKSNEMIQKTTHLYDLKGHLLERAEYDAYGELIQRNTYKYNDKDQIIEQQGHNTNGSLDFLIKFSYNHLGECVESVTTNPKGEQTSKLVQEYKLDDHNNWIKLTQYAEGKATYITERTIEYYP